MTSFPNRFGQLEHFAPRRRVVAETATVIGLGAVGRLVALQLTALGIPRLQLIDDARVEFSDITTKGFLHEDVGAARVDAVGSLCHRAEPMLDLESVHDSFRSSFEIGTIVFCCIDSVSDRARIRRALENRMRFWGEASLSGETVRVTAMAVDRGSDRGGASVIDVKRVQSALRSTRAPLYCASLAAGLLTYQATRYLRGLSPDVCICLDLPAERYVVTQT